MKKVSPLFVVLMAAFFALSGLASCRSAPLPEPPLAEEPLPEPYVPEPKPEPVLAEEPPPPFEFDFEPHEFELRVFELTNLERANHRLPPLIWYELASFVARGHCIDMQSNDLMRHTGSDGSNPRQRLERVGITNIGNMGANIAGGWTTPEAVVAAWMESPRHRPNILSREFTHLGVGYFERPEGSNARFATYWTQKFFTYE